MAGGGGGRELDQTPTWAVSLVCGVIIIISIILEEFLHKVGHTFQKRKKMALVEALEKIKAELMVLGFISLLLTFGQNYISRICIPERLADTMLPCEKRRGHHHPHAAPPDHSGGHAPPGGGQEDQSAGAHHRRLLSDIIERRFLAADSQGHGCKHGYVPLISLHGLHQIHIFIFFLAVFHVIYSAITMLLGRLKIRGWKAWEKEFTKEYDASNDAARFRLTHETSFVRGHTSTWTKNPVFFYIACFFRHMFYSVQKADYLTLRHGFVSVHLSTGTKFDFQKYIKRSLEDDFKVVVGIPPHLWLVTVIYLLLTIRGYHDVILSILPLLMILAIGTKLQSIVSHMAVEIQEKHAVVQGIPLVQVSDEHFWFGKPTLVLHLIHLTLFQNAFEITYFIWISYEFGLFSCFHSNFVLAVVRVAIGVGVQVLCSYITLPLYALVTQMGSHMKRSIFDEQTSKALMSWHNKAKKKPATGPVPPRTRKLGGSPGDSDSPENSPTTVARNHVGESTIEMNEVPSTPPDNNRNGNIDLLSGP